MDKKYEVVSRLRVPDDQVLHEYLAQFDARDQGRKLFEMAKRSILGESPFVRLHEELKNLVTQSGKLESLVRAQAATSDRVHEAVVALLAKGDGDFVADSVQQRKEGLLKGVKESGSQLFTPPSEDAKARVNGYIETLSKQLGHLQ